MPPRAAPAPTDSNGATIAPMTEHTEVSVTAAAERRMGERSTAPFVLVHGLASNVRLWDGVAGHLHALGHTVVAIDQRGHGRSDAPDSGYDLATAIADLRALIGALGLERPVLTGQS